MDETGDHYPKRNKLHQTTQRSASVHSTGETEKAFKNDLYIIKHVAEEKGRNGETEDLKNYGSQLRVTLLPSPGDTWQCLETFLVVKKRQGHSQLVGRGQGCC